MRSKLKITVFNINKAGQDKARQTHRNTGSNEWTRPKLTEQAGNKIHPYRVSMDMTDTTRYFKTAPEDWTRLKKHVSLGHGTALLAVVCGLESAAANLSEPWTAGLREPAALFSNKLKYIICSFLDSS